jgi:hypothetical protein
MNTHPRLVSLLDMFKINAAAYQNAMTTLAQTIAYARHAPGDLQMKKMGEAAAVTRGMLARVDNELEPLRVPVTRATIRDALTHIDENTQYIGCGQILLNVQGTLSRELESAKLFALEASRGGFYEPDEPLFGARVDAMFPSVADEIANGGKAYACELTTAATFHWIRCMEAGTRAMARCLGIPDPTKGRDRNWANLKANINAEIEKRWPASSGRMGGDAKLFDELIGSIGAMTNPYRNATMHFDSTYSAGEAMHIFELVKGLMQKVASRMDQDGLPMA